MEKISPLGDYTNLISAATFTLKNTDLLDTYGTQNV